MTITTPEEKTVSNPSTITAQPGVPFIEITREFEAPLAAVFRAHTDPELFAQWTGPASMHMDRVELDARVGGKWGYTFRGDGDAEFGFFGVFHAVEANALLIHTFEFNLAPGEVGVSTTRFEELGGRRARLTLREVYPSVEARDAAIASGMEYGIREGYTRLDEVLAG